VAHELGHLAMHRSFLRKAHSEIEDEAFRFAAEWLMPESAMRSVIQDPVTLTSVANLKPIWGVSLASLVKRAFDLSLITQRQYHYLFHQLGNLGWKTREPPALDIPVERPRRYRKMVEIVYGKPIDFAALAADSHVTAQELRRILTDFEESSGVEPGLKSNVLRFSR
jgi:Zn-dependent peptidase ImmA (M78 family)